MMLALLAVAAARSQGSAWESWKVEYGREYATAEEEQQRYEVFESNLAYIEDFNAKETLTELAMNQFGDLTRQEFANKYLTGFNASLANIYGGAPYKGRHLALEGEELPSAVDWSAKGAVTPIKDQAQCGSCWAFSTTGALEGAWEIKTGKLVSLSEQQIVDCSKGGNMGCNGGSMDLAFKWAEKQALCTEASYPYKGKNGKCQKKCKETGIPKGGVTGFKDVSADSENSLMSAVAQQPVSIAIEADQNSFQFYKQGVLTKSCGTQLDHGVLAVGYGTLNGQAYWKVKNSWGKTWGMDGYVLLQRGKNKKGQCGILMQPTYPIVSGKAEAMLV